MPESSVRVEGAHTEEPEVTIEEECQHESPSRQVRQAGRAGGLGGRASSPCLRVWLCPCALARLLIAPHSDSSKEHHIRMPLPPTPPLDRWWRK